MKEKSNFKQTTAFLMAIVLVVGLAGVGGHVYGQADDTDTSDVTLEVSSIEAQVNITELTITTDENYNGTISNTYNIIEWNETNDEQTHSYENIIDPEWIDNITVEVNVSAAEGTQLDGNINYTWVDIWTSQGDATRGSWTNPGDETGENTQEQTDGDAHNYYGVLWSDDVFNGITDNYTTLSYQWTITGDSNAETHAHLLRAGGSSHDWEVEAYVLDEEGGEDYDNPVSDTTDENTFDVDTFAWISVGNPSTPTVAPGDTAGPADFGDTDIEFSINAAWSVSNESYVLTGPDESTDVTLDDTDVGYDTLGTYEISGTSPTANNVSHIVQYEVNVPAGTPSGTYDGTVTHNIYNEDT